MRINKDSSGLKFFKRHNGGHSPKNLCEYFSKNLLCVIPYLFMSIGVLILSFIFFMWTSFTGLSFLERNGLIPKVMASTYSEIPALILIKGFLSGAALLSLSFGAVYLFVIFIKKLYVSISKNKEIISAISYVKNKTCIKIEIE